MVQIFEHRETVMGLFRLTRTVCERLGESDGATAQAGYPVTKMLAHIIAWGSMVQIFEHRETVMGLRRLTRTVCERLGESDGATAQAAV